MVSMAFFALIGLCVGSFLNVLTYRLPRNIDIFFARSHCVGCKKSLSFYHLVPIFSWLFLNGKCAFCKGKISPRYPIVELLSCAIFMLVALKLEPTNLQDLAFAALFALCFSLLFGLSMIDIEHKAVPDTLLFFTLGLSLFFAIFAQESYQNLLAATAFALVFFALRFIVSKILKKEAMGSADIFIAAIIGALLGFTKGVFGIYLGAVFTLPFYFFARDKNYELAFVPFLTAGAFISFLAGEEILKQIGFL
ncbi:prepilin peptidase [Campylobacter sp. 9BO]|uniref:prepilin peptidase n=1 Tax=Campylobacter sp. 9BO TaxID=3424759 RepID=UPI003D344804